MTVKRKAVIYRRGLNKMSKDKNMNRPGYVMCSHCKTWRKRTDTGIVHHNQYLTRTNGYLPCPNPDSLVIVPVVEPKTIVVRKKKPCEDVYLRENIRSLRDQEYTLGQIAKYTGISPSKARSILDTLAETD